MTTFDAPSPNAAQIEHWNGPAGETWVRLQARLDAQLAPLGRHAMERAAIRAGERILDIGCGTGQTSMELAQRVGANGSVFGVDISAPMLALAKRRASATNMGFEQGDAQTHRFAAGGFDLVFSRFGVMFFANPVTAFGNLRRALRPGGRIAFVCWRPVRDNPWVAIPMEAAFRHVPRPPAPEPGAPGEFAFADAARVRAILAGAGFADIAVDPHDHKIGGFSLEDSADLALQMGPVAAALRENGGSGRDAVAAAVREALAPFAGADGVRLSAGVWIATATAP